MLTRIQVSIPERPGAVTYEIAIGPGALREAKVYLQNYRRVAIVTQKTIPLEYAERVRAGYDGSEFFFMGDGEDQKTLKTVEELCSQFARWGLLRGDAVVAVGGGIVCVTTGFAAAIYHRGVKVLKVPTTLLAQVDAASGGKTGVNLSAGKNLVGAFHQPIGVLADTETLRTLIPRDYRSGLGEVAKYALMPDGAAVEQIINRDLEAIRDRDPTRLAGLIAACVQIKKAVVERDPNETEGIREVLNYGHTLGHALETAGGHGLRHGEAVATGLVFAAELAYAMGRIGPSEVARHREIVTKLDLPDSVPDGLTVQELTDLMRRDKKSNGGLAFVLPGKRGLERVYEPDMAHVLAAFEAVGVTTTRPSRAKS